MDRLPAAVPGTAVRVLATTDLAAELIPRRVSWGEGGTCAGVVELLERERERQPTVGNHEFDDGVPALLEAARVPAFPLLCANVDVGLPGGRWSTPRPGGWG